MWHFSEIFIFLTLVIYSASIPKQYRGINPQLPKNTRTTGARLDHNVIPQNYKIELTVLEENILNKNFSGIATITLKINQALTQFPIHVKDIEITSLTLSGGTYTGTLTKANEPDENDFLQLTSNTTIEALDNYKLTINYNGILSDTDMEGFYQSQYLDASGGVHYLATTYFETMGARRAFPCFDEPDFKATFDIIITHTDTYNAIANTDKITTPSPRAGTTTTTFKQTPKMSTYLVAFIVSEFLCKEGTPTENGVPTNVCTRFTEGNTTNLALDTAPKALNAMNSFTGVKYQEMNVGKMTQAAIPDFAIGAMENWGMVTYREADLLWDENESSNYYKQTVVTVITHEFSHQWFGDKITLDWWSDIFLNEGFATYFEYYATQNIDTARDWELPKQFVLEQLQPVLVTDSDNSSLPLSYQTNDPDVIASMFNDISYNKGGSVLRMVQNFLGLENFKTGLTTYLGSDIIGTPESLWTALNGSQPTDEAQKLPAPLITVMDSWTHKPGYPYLTLKLDANNNNISVTQERFLISGEDTTDPKWYVPITYTKSNDTNGFATTATQVWLVPDTPLTITLDGADWIILNNQQVGYYRVYYDDVLLEKISTALNSANQGNIDEISRSQIIDDQVNFARAGLKDYGEVLKFLGFLRNDTSYYAWTSAFNGYSYLLKRIASSTIKEALNNFILEQMTAVLETVPLTGEPTNQIQILKKVITNTWACKLGQEQCVNHTKSALADFIADETKNRVKPDLRSIVYCYGLRNSDDPQNAYNFLYSQYNSSQLATEKVTILKSLGCVGDSDIRREYLQKALTNEIKLQDARYVFSSVYSQGPEGVNDVLWLITEKYADFEPHFGTTSTLSSLILTLADLFTTSTQIDAYRALPTLAADLDASNKAACEKGVEIATSNLQTIEKLETSLTTYFQLDNDEGSAEINSYHVVNLALLLVVYFIFSF